MSAVYKPKQTAAASRGFLAQYGLYGPSCYFSVLAMDWQSFFYAAWSLFVL